MTCVCGRPAVARIPAIREHVCATCATEFWSGIVQIGATKARHAQHAEAVIQAALETQILEPVTPRPCHRCLGGRVASAHAYATLCPSCLSSAQKRSQRRKTVRQPAA